MHWNFWKMHGAGNDFVLGDDRQLTFPTDDPAGIVRLCDRRRGIGSDGLLLIQPATQPDAAFRMRFFNPDGGEADLCGNGARCIARLAHDIGAAPADMHIETAAGLLRAICLDSGVRLFFPPPRDWRLNLLISASDTMWPVHFVNSGVPHAMVCVKEVAAVNMTQLGTLIRHHRLFAPEGTNVNAVQITGHHSLAIRTFERGVEAETLACGTGMVAAALLATKLNLVRAPVTLHTAGGDQLTVELEPLTLTGPAEYSFRGTINYR